jgi:hypothetical protein
MDNSPARLELPIVDEVFSEFGEVISVHGLFVWTGVNTNKKSLDQLIAEDSG